MTVRKLLIVLLLVAVIIFLALFLRECREKPPAESPIVIFDSHGNKVSKVNVLDTVLVQVEDMAPSTHYDIRLMRSDGMEISHARLTSDRNGVIPPTPLWHDVGVTYEKGSRTGVLNIEEMLSYKYRVVVSGLKREFTLPMDIAELKPQIFSADENGNPLNGFRKGSEGVYVVGRNFPPGTVIRLYVVDDRYSWEHGDDLMDVTGGYTEVTLAAGETGFKAKVWDEGQARLGSYDIIADSLPMDGLYSATNTDPNDGDGSTGFVIQDEPGPDHIEQAVTCQAPSPPPPVAPNPRYKDAFAVGEEIWVAVNPLTQGQNYTGMNARIYVTNHIPEASYVHGMALNDASGGFETTVIQPGCANVNYNLIWPNPTAGKYDVVIDFEPFGFYDKGTDIVDMLEPVGLLVGDPDIAVSRIQFNWGAGSGAANLIDHVTNAAVPAPEWDGAANINEPAAYVRGSTITVKAQFHKNTAAAPDTAVIWAEAAGYGISLAPQTVNFGGASDSAYVDFTITTPLINYVNKNDIIWQWYYAEPPYPGSVQNPMNVSSHTICTTFSSPLDSPVYKMPMLWTSEWARYKSNEKAIVDAIIAKLHLSGLKYGVSGWEIDNMLDNGGGMCGGWRKLFAHMAAAQGVNLYQRCYILKNDAAPSPEIKWDSIVIKDGGLNQTQPTRPAATYSDVDAVYPDPSTADITSRTEKRYRFYAPGDGHCIDFLQYQGTIYLYDPSFGKGPFANTFASVPSGTATGTSLTDFRANYHDTAIDYMMGNIRLSDGSHQYLTIKTGLIPDLRTPGDPASFEMHYEWY